MDHFAGLDVSVKETSICIVDDTGRIMKEVKVCQRASSLTDGSGEPGLPLQAGSDWKLGRYRNGFSSGLAEAGLKHQ